MPTADDIAETIAQTAADGVQSATVDGNSATALPIADQIKAFHFQQQQEASTGTNANGGPRSGWGMVRQARSVPPGAV